MNALDHPNSVLQRLIIEGETVLQRRRIDAASTLELLDAVKVLLARPVDGARVVDHHTMLYAAALAQAGMCLSEHNPQKAAKFGRVVAVLIDDIREDFSRAIELSKRPTP